MKPNAIPVWLRSFRWVGVAGFFSSSILSAAEKPSSIPFAEIGERATAEYCGDSNAIVVTEEGVRLRAGFQKLTGEVTASGLWLESTDPDGGGTMRLVSTALRRADGPRRELAAEGKVIPSGETVSFSRPGLTEEYGVSVDGIRQDFVIPSRPAGEAELRLELRLDGATAETIPEGARLTLSGSGRELAYTRLHVTDAMGRALDASIEVRDTNRLEIRVNDEAAIYPVRIDPTFSDADWISMGSLAGVDAPVHAVAVDGADNLYVGGQFTMIDGVEVNHIAKWDGNSWSALGSGVDNWVNALAVSGTDVYAGGEFTMAGGVAANRVAKWDGNTGTWSAVGQGIDGGVYALAVMGSNLFAGGFFNSVGGDRVAHNLAQWDGNQWISVGGGLNNGVFALAVSGSDLFVGGFFNVAQDMPVGYVAKWNGVFWGNLDGGVDGPVYTLATSGSDVYAGGWFSGNIAKWNGSTWSVLGDGLNSDVYSLAVSGTNLYAGGIFTASGATPLNRIARWDMTGGTWNALGTGMDDQVRALAVSGSNLFVGGSFTTAGGGPAVRVASWSPAGSSWSGVSGLGGLSLGLGGSVEALAVSDTGLYLGGAFTSAGGMTVNHIVKWDGNAWLPLGTGMNDQVNALAVSGTYVYAGGRFTTADGMTAINLARWDETTSTWSDLGLESTSYWVEALAVSGTDLYVGGRFLSAGGTSAIHIAQWDEATDTWSALGSPGSGMNLGGFVYALAVSGTDLYAAGAFTTAGGVPANRIARWNGNSWSALGSGMNGDVTALAVSGDDLFVGGSFTSAGGNPADHIAKWDASSGTWNALGPGTSGPVEALLAFGSDLYVGGSFTAAGGNPANRIAKWNGIAWSALGSGMNGPVKALAAGEMVVFAGGDFTRAGGKTSVYAARAEVPPEIEVSGNGMPILDGTTTPDEAQATDFGSAVASEGATVVRSFLIFNDGLSDLTLGPVSIDGSHPGDFAVSQSPATTVPSGGSTLLEVTFDPTALGLRTAILNIPSNDADEAVFDFAVQGTGLPSSNANLAALTLGDGTLTPAFDAATTGYTASVANATSSFTVTPTVAEANATLSVRINGGSFAPATSGQASGALPLPVGSNAIEVRVTAQDTTTIKVYTVTVTRDKATQTITFANPGDQIATATVNLSATGGGSGNAVTFAVSDGPGSISGGNVLTFTGAGSVTITASQAGNSEYHDATPVARTFNVSLASQTLTLDSPGDRFLSEMLTLAATGGGSGSGLVYEVVDGPGVITNGNELSFTGGGEVTVRVSQAGDDLHADADPMEHTFAVILPRPDVAVGATPSSFIGSTVYAPDVQIAGLVSNKARPVTGYLALANRVVLPDDRAADVVVLRGGQGNGFFRVAYHDPAGNATAAVLAGTYQTPLIDGDDVRVLLRSVVTPNKKKLTKKKGRTTVILRKSLMLPFSVSSSADPSIQDAASIRVQTR